VAARIRIPALVRGKELITENGLFGNQTNYAKLLLDDKDILSAGFFIGNPFTDVPELCSQAYVYTNNEEELAKKHVLKMANDFWPNRSKMQTELLSLEESIELGSKSEGTIVFTDAADAPSSGALGDSNKIIYEMINNNYPHSILSTILDSEAAKLAHKNGVGSKIKTSIGGKLDARFEPLVLEWEIISVNEEPFMPERWVWLQKPGKTAVLKSKNLTVVVTSNPVMQVDRAIYLENNLNPKDFHTVIVKSPHCEPEFYDDWVKENFNVDSPGSTSANLSSLGHKHCKRPIYPLEKDTEFTPTIEIY
jgi:microcystin degradation protein MlrC